MVFAVLSIIPVAWSLQMRTGRLAGHLADWRPMGWPGALALPGCAYLTAAVIGGYLGGRARVAHRVGGALIALAIAWPIGIAVLPAAATAVGVPLRAGIMCIDGCTRTSATASPGAV